MGEFQRSRSKVWWSNYAEVDTEDDRNVGWGGAGPVLSPSRGSSSSPSSSHKSQDSGFSDSEASSTTGGAGHSFKPSPASSQEPDRSASPVQDPQEVTGRNQDCQCPQTGKIVSGETSSVRHNSPVSKQKGQLFSQCSCLGQTSQNDIHGSTTENAERQIDINPELTHRIVQCPTQLPVTKLREKFLRDCICLNQTPENDCVPECPDRSGSDKPASPLQTEKQTRQEISQQSGEECKRAETDDVIGEQRQEHRETSIPQECVNSEERSLQTRPQNTLNRAVPVPAIRRSQRSHKESLSKSVRESPIASPRSLKNEYISHSQCNTNSLSLHKPSEEGSDHLQSPSKQINKPLDLTVQLLSSQGRSRQQGSSLEDISSSQSSADQRNVSSPRPPSDPEESPSGKPLCSELPEQLGSPAHTSTPKLLVTPNRPLRCSGSGKKHCRPVNLLNNFTSGSKPDGANSERNPVQRWLGELATLCEPECMTTLQSKSLAVDLSRQVAMMAAATTDTVKMLQEGTKLISTEFAKLCQQLDYGKMEHVGPLVQSLVGLVTEFIHEHCNKQEETRKQSQTEQETLTEVCDRLRITAARHPPNKEELTSEITELGNNFTNIVDNILTHHISVLVEVLEEPTSDMALRSALSSLTAFGLEGPHLSRLVAHCSGVRALLSICLESRSSTIRTAALRALATVCCVAEAIRQLEQAGGVEILSEMLSEEARPEPEVSEAAAVLAQITAPWVEDNHTVHGLSEQLSSLVHSLTRLASTTASCETLLLSAAALANLTFMEPRTVWPLLEQGTAGKLLQAVKRQGPKVSVFLQEQAATLIANMAAVPESRPHLAEQRAVVALLCFLQIRHSPLQRAPEIAAAERVQQKSAIALSRLCSDPVVAAQVVELQGVNRLVRLCKEERERNHSDGVLVACLAALRKISANCGTKVIEDLDAMELVEPRLLDSFLIYSSRQESYV